MHGYQQKVTHKISITKLITNLLTTIRKIETLLQLNSRLINIKHQYGVDKNAILEKNY